MARLENNAGFMRKLRDSQNAVLGQRCSNPHGRYMTIEEFIGGGQRGFILFPRRQEEMGLVWAHGDVAVFAAPFTSMKQEPTLEKWFFAQVVASQCDPITSNSRRARGAPVATHQKVWPLRHAQSAAAQLPSAANAIVPSDVRIMPKQEVRESKRGALYSLCGSCRSPKKYLFSTLLGNWALASYLV